MIAFTKIFYTQNDFLGTSHPTTTTDPVQMYVLPLVSQGWYSSFGPFFTKNMSII
jgi:hypothetical protein